ncbi:MAG: hypothetical protein HGA45_39785, partial [Chloroflexales bacterium]|nr:hypothetical protein [Chloroflexales bacterium]
MLRRETLPNLRFRLGEVLVEIVTHGMGLPGAMSNPIAAALSALSFLRSVNKLA